MLRQAGVRSPVGLYQGREKTKRRKPGGKKVRDSVDDLIRRVALYKKLAWDDSGLIHTPLLLYRMK
jgi:hypothetical protein